MSQSAHCPNLEIHNSHSQRLKWRSCGTHPTYGCHEQSLLQLVVCESGISRAQKAAQKPFRDFALKWVMRVVSHESVRTVLQLLLVAVALTVPSAIGAGPLHLLPPDARVIAKFDTSSNFLAEGVSSGSIGDFYYLPFGPPYTWHRTVTQIASNGLYRADYSIRRGKRSRAPAEPDLSVLFFRPPARDGSSNTMDGVNWPARLAEQLQAQQQMQRGVHATSKQVEKVFQLVEDAFLGVQFFAANAARYEFAGTHESVSFVTALPAGYPGVTESDAPQASRIRFYLEEQKGGRTSVVLEHVPLLLDGYAEPFRVELARGVDWFGFSYLDRSGAWSHTWSNTNELPQTVSALLSLMPSGQFTSRRFLVSAAPVPNALQGGLSSVMIEPSSSPHADNDLLKLRLSKAQPHAIELEWLGRSGVELACYILSMEPNTPHGLNQKWAGGPGDSNSLLVHLPMQNFPLGGGTISLHIKDLDRQANINLALVAPELLNSACVLAGLDYGPTQGLLDSIRDWLDPDETPRANGAESAIIST